MDNNDPRILAAMYKSDGADRAVEKIKERIQINEQNITPHKNITVIKLNNKAIAVPTVGHIQELEKEVNSLKTRANQLASENRQLKLALKQMSKQIAALTRELDNKIDKL